MEQWHHLQQQQQQQQYAMPVAMERWQQPGTEMLQQYTLQTPDEHVGAGQLQQNFIPNGMPNAMVSCRAWNLSLQLTVRSWLYGRWSMALGVQAVSLDFIVHL